MTGLLAAAVAAAFALPALGQGTGYGYGPGMMGRGGSGYGYGAPGMMGGPGMMNGPGGGYGQRGMRGYGGGAGLDTLDLTDEQRQKILAIQEEGREKNWSTMGKMRAENFKLRNLYYADNLDANQLVEQQRKVDDLRREMLKSHVESRKKVEAVLTAEQRKQLRGFGPWWIPEGGE